MVGALVSTDIIRGICKWSGMAAALGMKVGGLGIRVGGILACMLSHFSRVWLFVTPRTVASRAPLSMGFPSQEYWSELPLPPPGDLPDPGIKSPDSLALTGGSFTTGSLGTPGRETYFLPNPHLYSWNVLSVPNSFKIISYTELVAHQAHLSMEFSRQEYWSGLPFPFPENLS